MNESVNNVVENDAVFSDFDQYLFAQGTHYDIYKKLGAHCTEIDGRPGTYFAVWAPNASAVSVIGSFNDWNAEAHKMEKRFDVGVWDIFVPEAKAGDYYKFKVVGYDGITRDKADPYGRYAEVRPGTASIIWDDRNQVRTDAKWMKKRVSFDIKKEPMVIYECHIGSWMRHHDNRYPEGFHNYREFAEHLADYLEEMHYTHVELMGISEHPFDGSWGYQVTGYFAPTARYGTPADFCYMIDYLHNRGIGVILDWVPAHFPKDECGLSYFDGTGLYEHADPRQGEHPDWGTKIFNFGRNEVKNFLIASAFNWVDYYHIDGLRVDAVASMLYLDYGRNAGEWVPNQYGDNRNLEAIEFFHHLNSLMEKQYPGVMMIAEESTAWPAITTPVEDGGLGFDMKWNMGWMHDFLEYMKLDPIYRQYHHYNMTFSTSYANSEKFILVLSHDEVVHLKCSMWNKMPGSYEEKFHNLRAAYTYMCGHQGKKLLFMGQEFGQKEEWSESREIDWASLQEPMHAQMKDYVRDLWKLYGQYPALYATDYDPDGFEWINADDTQRSIYSFMRKAPAEVIAKLEASAAKAAAKDGEGISKSALNALTKAAAKATAKVDGVEAEAVIEACMPTVPLKRKPKERDLLFVLNMTPVARDDYRVGVPRPCKLRLVLNSMDPIYGGYAPMNKTGYKSQRGDWDHRPYNVPVALPPYACLVFEIIETEPDPKELAEDAVNYVDAKVAEMAAAKAAEEEAKAAAEAAAKEAEEAKAAEADSACCCGASDENEVADCGCASDENESADCDCAADENAAADCGCTADENESAACDCAADEKAVAEAPAKKAGKKSGKKLSRRARKALKK